MCIVSSLPITTKYVILHLSMNIELLIKYCDEQTEKKWKTAEALLKSKRYADCLFFCHLALEFTLKSKVAVTTQRPFPITHDLVDLAKKSTLTYTKHQLKQLAIISTFNIAGRYDDFKLSFYKKATPEYSKKYYAITKELIEWLKKTSEQPK